MTLKVVEGQIFSSTVIYLLILKNKSMNANMMKMQIFHKMKNDLKGHIRPI